ncbi:helix-turn-helix domain-containing protein [bacterium]|nr:helix-turn-helix domain-containing protein [bacterium]
MSTATETRNCTLCGCPPIKFLRVTTVAKALNVDPKTARNLIACGKVEAVRIGTAWRVVHESLESCLRAQHSLEGDGVA